MSENKHSHRWGDNNKCEKCGDRDWYSESHCSVADSFSDKLVSKIMLEQVKKEFSDLQNTLLQRTSK